jgi:hypothetical protein
MSINYIAPLDILQQDEISPGMAQNLGAQSETSSALAQDDSKQQETVEGCDATDSSEGAHPDDTFANHPEAFEHIMSRVTSSVPLQILESSIPDAGYGLFLREDISAGEDVLTSQPLVNHVNFVRDKTCDYCLMRPCKDLPPGGSFRESMPKSDNKLLTCINCKTCYYCSKV